MRRSVVIARDRPHRGRGPRIPQRGPLAAPVSCSPVPPELRHEHILQRTDFERIGHGVDRSGTVAQARRSRARGKSVVVGVAIFVAGLVAGCGGSSTPQAAWDAQLTDSITRAMRQASIPGPSSVCGRREARPMCGRSASATRRAGQPMAADISMRIGSNRRRSRSLRPAAGGAGQAQPRRSDRPVRAGRAEAGRRSRSASSRRCAAACTTTATKPSR